MEILYILVNNVVMCALIALIASGLGALPIFFFERIPRNGTNISKVVEADRMKAAVSLLPALLLFSSVVSAYGQETAAEQEKEKNPFRLSVTYTGESWGNLSGGIAKGIRYMDNVDVNMEIDLGELPLGLSETTVHVYGLGNQGGSISSLAGDFQGVSNIETPNSWRFFEVWAQKKFILANSSILFGLYDINSEFNVLNSSLLFINSSHGIDASLAASGVLGPSTFPYTSVGGRLKMGFTSGWVFQAAVLDGIPSNPASPRGTKIYWRERDGLLYLAELGYYSNDRRQLQFRDRTARLRNLLGRNTGSGPYKIAIGGWAYSRKRPGWQPGNAEERDMGLYILGEYQVYAEEQDHSQGLTLFGRGSIANEKINRLAAYIGGGLVYQGLITGRPEDEAGLAVAHAINSSDYIGQSPLLEGYRAEQAETNMEFTYLSVLTPSVSLQGDIQYIINPGMNPNLDNAFSVGLRFILSL